MRKPYDFLASSAEFVGEIQRTPGGCRVRPLAPCGFPAVGSIAVADAVVGVKKPSIFSARSFSRSLLEPASLAGFNRIGTFNSAQSPTFLPTDSAEDPNNAYRGEPMIEPLADRAFLFS